MERKESSYMEIVAIMDQILIDMNSVSDKLVKAFKIHETLPDPVTDKEKAIAMVIEGTSDVLLGSVENIVTVLEYYNKAKYAVKRK